MRILQLLLLALLPLQLLAQRPVSVFITAGQSNADGRARIASLPSYLQGGPDSLLHFANITDDGNGRFGQRRFDDPRGRWAFSDVTHHLISQALATDFYAVKCTYGGTAIEPGTGPLARPVWSASEAYLDTARTYRKADGRGQESLAKALVERFAMLADTTLSRLQQGYDVKAIMWHQGESDRQAAGKYYKNLKTLIAYLRQEIYRKTGDPQDQHLPFILGTVAHKSRQYSAAVEAAHYQLAEEDPDVYLIDMSDGALLSDQLHFDSLATDQLGRRMYNMLVEAGAVEGQKVAVGSPAPPTNDYGVAIAKWKDDKYSALSYTFDDALLDQYELLFPVLRELQLPATFAINGATIERYARAVAAGQHNTDTDILKWPRMSWQMVKEMSQAGMEMSSHGWEHKKLVNIDGEEARYEIQHNDTAIYNATGVFPRTYFYPNNVTRGPMASLVLQDRVGTRKRQITAGGHRNAQWFDRWLRHSIVSGGWSIAMTHALVKGYDSFGRHPEIFLDHLRHAATQQDSLWIATFHDVAAYEREREALTYTVEQKGRRLIVNPTLDLDPKIFNHPLTLTVNAKVKRARQQGRRLTVKQLGPKAIINFDPHGGEVVIEK